MYQLYDYQLDAVNQLRESMRDHKRVCLCLPTGGGKTIIFSDIANKAVSKGKRVLVCVHRTELKNQAERTTNATVVMVEKLNNLIKANKININDYDLIIIDEVHIGNFRKVLDNYDGYVIGATATPVTINKLYPLKNLLNDIVVPTDISTLINLGRFDIKWIRSRCMFHKVPMFPRYLSFDTLKFYRGSTNQPSNRLDDIGDYFGIGRKVKNEDGLWIKVVENNDRRALKRMVKYCDGDVLLLEKVYKLAKPYAFNKVHNTGVKSDCPECGSDDVKLKGFYYTCSGTKKQRIQCNNCDKKFLYTPPKKKVK